MRQIILFSILVCFINCKDNVLITSITIPSIDCTKLNVTINSKSFDSSCESSSDGAVLISKTGESGDENKNYTIGVQYDSSYIEGVFVVNLTEKVNTIQQTIVTLKPLASSTTTSAPTTTTTHLPTSTTSSAGNPTPTTTTTQPTTTTKSEVGLTPVNATISWIRIEYDDSSKTVQSGNGAAVTVAILEGLVLIGILCYFGYRTMIVQKRKTEAMNAAYDFNAQQNAMRMSDIPARRNSTGFSNPNSTPQPVNPVTLQNPSRTFSSTPDLVVPPAANNTVATHQDPFATLDNW